jgi:hypothetical protein
MDEQPVGKDENGPRWIQLEISWVKKLKGTLQILHKIEGGRSNSHS